MTRVLLPLLLLAWIAEAQNTLVVTPDSFRPALKEWKAYREAQGHKITVTAPPDDILSLARKGFDFLVIVGDVKQVPCTYVPADIIRRWERARRIATDHHLADIDGDGAPDLAVGRIPADNPAEAAAMLKKSIAYEKNRNFTSWRRRINVIAGVGGFGKFQDKLIEQAATYFLSRNIPYSYDLHVTYANPNSPFCPPPEQVGKVALKRFNEGAFFVTYLGHGSIRRLDSMRFNKRRYPIFREDDAYELAAERGAPMVFLSCCSSGHLDAVPDCLAETMLKQEKGPVAVIASSRVSMPYGNGVLAKELLTAIFLDRRKTIGEALMQAKARSIDPKPGDVGRQHIEGLAMFYQPKKALRDKEVVEHLYLYNLIGDPTLRIPQLGRLGLALTQADGKLKLSGTSPVDGTAVVEWVSERKVPAIQRAGDEPKHFAETYARANRRARPVARVAVRGGRFEAEVPPGEGWLRVYVQGEAGAAAGFVRFPKPK